MSQGVGKGRAEGLDSGQLKALVDLMFSRASARKEGLPLNHAPETLTRSPAKLEVLVNALLVFIDKGITDTTVQDLLDASGISRRTFYKYFRNKLDVLESLYALAVDIMVLRYRADIADTTSVGELARRFTEVFFAFHRDLAPVIRMMQEEAIRQDSPLARRRADAMSLVIELVNRQLVQICGKPVDPLLLRSLMWGLEAASIELLRGGTPADGDIERSRAVMTHIVEAALTRPLSVN
ncbi:MAG: TetR/AcrR family transcriptional regulator [Pseudomonadota bacterium]